MEYIDPNVLTFIWQTWHNGISFAQTIVMAGIYSAARFGQASHTTNTVKEILGREPITIEQFATEWANNLEISK